MNRGPGQCEDCGVVLSTNKIDACCPACIGARAHRAIERANAAKANPNSKLKLYACRVIYNDPDKRNSWFTVLDVSEMGAEVSVINRVSKFRNLQSQRGHVSVVEVTEIEGPFSVGQILHEER